MDSTQPIKNSVSDTIQPLVSIITINYNSTPETLEFIDSLLKSSYSEWELFVVDNASKEFDPEILENTDTRINLIESKVNLGFAGGNNLALSSCSGEYLFFVNNDTILPVDTLSKLVNTASTLPDLGALSPKFEYYHTPGMIEYAGCTNINIFTARNKAIGNQEQDNEDLTGLIETYYMHGGGMLVPAKVLEKVGPMANEFFLYYEEMDWSERMRRAGYKIYCQRDARIYHKESASVGRLNPLKTYYMNRNRLLFMFRNYNTIQLLPFIFFFTFISIPKNTFTFLIRGDFEHLRAFLRGVFYFADKRLTFNS
jgi:GT2 family glycosyltransferase